MGTTFNAQASVDESVQVIVAADVAIEPNDLEQLVPMIEQTISTCLPNGLSKTKMAEKLKISRATLYRKFKKYGIEIKPDRIRTIHGHGPMRLCETASGQHNIGKWFEPPLAPSQICAYLISITEIKFRYPQSTVNSFEISTS